MRTTERYRRTDFGHMQVEVTYIDPDAYVKPWGITLTMRLAADTEMLEAICEWSSNNWTGTLSDGPPVVVPPEVLAKYVGVYKGPYGGKERTVDVSLSGGKLIAKFTGGGDVEGGRQHGVDGRGGGDRRQFAGQGHGDAVDRAGSCSKGWDSGSSSWSTTRGK
jgi:hypothetical protein